MTDYEFTDAEQAAVEKAAGRLEHVMVNLDAIDAAYDIAQAIQPALAEATRSAAADMLKEQADSIRKSAGEFIGDDLLAYVQGMEYAVDRLRGVPQAEAAVTL